jgi:hypothetical protein
MFSKLTQKSKSALMSEHGQKIVVLLHSQRDHGMLTSTLPRTVTVRDCRQDGGAREEGIVKANKKRQKTGNYEVQFNNCD